MAGVIEQTAFARLSRRADVEAVGQFDQLQAREAPPRDLDDDRFGEVREQVAGADMNIRLGRRSHSPPRPPSSSTRIGNHSRATDAHAFGRHLRRPREPQQQRHRRGLDCGEPVGP
jgi:hypothetical protein